MYHFANAWDMNVIQTLFFVIIVVAVAVVILSVKKH